MPAGNGRAVRMQRRAIRPTTGASPATYKDGMRRRSARARAFVSGVVLLAGIATGDAARADDPDPPEGPGADEEVLDVGLAERVGTELAQFDVSLRGAPEVLAGLTPADFKIRIGLRRLLDFRIDRRCGDETGSAAAAAAALDPAVVPRPTYLLYFDQPHLTQAGRQRAIDLAREIVPALVAEGGQFTIVSNASEVATFAELETDADAIAAAFDALERDGRQWDSYASFEADRVAEVLRDLNSSGVDLAIQTARRHQRLERWIAEKNLGRLDHVLGRLADLAPPKFVLYFADTMRTNPGEHYLSFFSDRMVAERSTLSIMQTEATAASLAYDRVLRKSAATGARFYTIHAQGLSFDDNPVRLSLMRTAETGRTVEGSTVRIRDAQTALSRLAHETGGEVFLHAPRGDRIADRMLEDLACVFVFSFDPTPYDRDQMLPLRLEVLRDGVEAYTRGLVVLQSDEARRADRLLAAFTAPGSTETLFEIRDALVPIEFEDGSYRALLQLAVPAVPFTETTWDLGASVVPDRRAVSEEASGRLTIPPPGADAVFEQIVRVPVGGFRIVSVAHETGTDRIASTRRTDEWPNPDSRPATLGPIALLQPSAGVFVRDGLVRPSGSLAVAEDGVVESGLPAALVGIACRAKRMRRPILVERRLVGPVTVALEPTEVVPGEFRCVQIRDVIPAGTLEPGTYTYEMRAIVAGREHHRMSRRFVTVDDRPDGGS